MTEPISVELPAADELEISLFGPGYGECVAVHLGGGDWMIVDSCIDTRQRVHPALEYLKRLGVSSAWVKLVVASHWHDDHVRGISNVLRDCTEAKFACASAMLAPEFLTVVGAPANDRQRRSAGLVEMRAVFDLLEIRGRDFLRFAQADSPLHSGNVGNLSQTVVALSPSADAHMQCLSTVADLLEDVKKARKLRGGPNFTAVALHVQLGDAAALLGADLEDHGQPTLGWRAIVSSDLRPTQRANVHKVPHHGSSNGHLDEVYTDLLVDKPVSALTPFRRGSVSIPTQTRLDEISSLSSAAYISAAPGRRLPARLDPKDGTRARLGGALDITELYGMCGHIQIRLRQDGTSTVGLAAPARKLA